ncbi:MAG: VWA domain-containing protein [Pseudomonadota bacterium]
MAYRKSYWLAGAAIAITVTACEQADDPVPSEAPPVEEADASAPPLSEDGAIQQDAMMAEKTQRDLAMASPAPVMRMAPAPMSGRAPPPMRPQPLPGDVDTERYEDAEINPVKLVADTPVSTFSIDVDTAAYANVRRFINNGTLPPKDAVRIEELINYFDYAYPRPGEDGGPFASHVTVTPSPWADGRKLIHIGIQGYELELTERPPLNLTLLIDVSGSMGQPNKLPLAKKALGMLVDQLGDQDTVSIAVYAGAAGEILPPTPGTEKGKILAAFEALDAGGSTAGGEGLRLAYNLAERNLDPDGVNRVMLLTDGDFNVGINDPERLEDFISRKRETGIYLSVLGFGQGNYNDALMQTLAQSGNGMASYVDTLNEARKVLSDDLTGNLFPIADDVKIQVEFNPATVAEYRLIGYETRLLNREDFNNDAVDAGDIGAGASVTAIYEITAVGSDARLIDDSRYTPTPAPEGMADEYAFLKLRHKLPGEAASTLTTLPITLSDRVADIGDAPSWTRFATAVAGYGQLLRGDPYTAPNWGFDQVIELAQTAKGDDPFGYRAEFINLARLAKTAIDQEALQTRSPPGLQQ